MVESIHSENDEDLNKNPIKLMTEMEIKQYYSDAIFDFNEAYSQIPDPSAHFENQNHQFLARTSRISKIQNKNEYDEHTDLLHDYYRNPEILKNYFICKNKAFLKLCEIYDVFGFDFNGTRYIRSFHLCEGPGYFIDATCLAHLRSSSNPPTHWEWNANTLNPYFENISCFNKLIDDSHLRKNMRKWVFGPTDDGDVKKLTEEYLRKEGLAGMFDLVTADGSTNTQGQEGNIESIVNDLILAEVKASIVLLRNNGRLIIKMYRFCLKETRDIMFLLAENFSNIRAIKPMTSRPGSAERYIICDGFGGKMTLNSSILAQCDEFYLRKQLVRIDLHLASFQQKSMDFNKNDRENFMKIMKNLYFLVDPQIRRAIAPSCYSPWKRLYGHNMIRRLGEYEEKELPKAIGVYLDTTTVLPPTKLENEIDIDSMIDYVMEHEKLIVSSTVPLDIHDSLFIEPIAFQGLLSIKPSMHYDVFASTSTINDVPSEEWRRNLRISQKQDYTLEMSENTTIEHILMILKEGIENKMITFTLSNLPDYGTPLWLSRLSASMFCMFFVIFETVEIGKRQIRWSGMKNASMDHLLTRLLREISTLPRGTSVRCFMPLHILDTFHPLICYQNVSQLTVLWPKIEELIRRREEGVL